MEKSLSSIAVAAAAAALLAPGAANANTYQAPTVDSRGRVIILDPLSFIKVDDLHFGTYLIPTVGSGTVTINPIDSGMTMSGIVTPMPQSVPQRGWMIGSGSPGEDVQVTALLPARLYVDGDTAKPWINVTLNLDHLANSSGIYAYTINSRKIFNIYVGGSITIAAGQAPGLYSNDYVITATYL